MHQTVLEENYSDEFFFPGTGSLPSSVIFLLKPDKTMCQCFEKLFTVHSLLNTNLWRKAVFRVTETLTSATCAGAYSRQYGSSSAQTKAKQVADENFHLKHLPTKI